MSCHTQNSQGHVSAEGKADVSKSTISVYSDMVLLGITQ